MEALEGWDFIAPAVLGFLNLYGRSHDRLGFSDKL